MPFKDIHKSISTSRVVPSNTTFSLPAFAIIFEGLKNYYQVLRISRKAGEEEIKRAYWRLAVLFHPDKNRSAEALALFQEINEAHEVLSDPDKRSRYDESLQGGLIASSQPQQPLHRDPAYRRRQQGYRPPKAGPSERLLMMLHFLKFLRKTSLLGIVCCAFLLADYMLPPRISKERVLPDGNRRMTWQLHHEPNVLVTDKGNQFPIPPESVDFFSVGSEVEVVSSNLLNVLMRVDAENDRYVLDSLASIYQNLMIVPIMLLLVSLAGVFVKQGIEFRFNILICIFILMGFNLVFLLFSVL